MLTEQEAIARLHRLGELGRELCDRQSAIELPYSEAGEVLKTIRTAAQLSQRDFAQILGIAWPTICRIETGTQNVGPLRMSRIEWRWSVYQTRIMNQRSHPRPAGDVESVLIDDTTHYGAKSTIREFGNRLLCDRSLQTSALALLRRRLWCWCAPELCHGHLYLSWLWHTGPNYSIDKPMIIPSFDQLESRAEHICQFQNRRMEATT